MDNNEFDYVAAAAEFSDERSVWKQIWGAIRKARQKILCKRFSTNARISQL